MKDERNFPVFRGFSSQKQETPRQNTLFPALIQLFKYFGDLLIRQDPFIFSNPSLAHFCPFYRRFPTSGFFQQQDHWRTKAPVIQIQTEKKATVTRIVPLVENGEVRNGL